MNFDLTINYKTILTKIDWIVFFSILILTIAAIIYGQYRKKRQKKITSDKELAFLDLLLMGRQLTLPMFVATLVATWYGGIFGVTKIAFEQGIFNFITQGVFWYIAYILLLSSSHIKLQNIKRLPFPILWDKCSDREQEN